MPDPSWVTGLARYYETQQALGNDMSDEEFLHHVQTAQTPLVNGHFLASWQFVNDYSSWG